MPNNITNKITIRTNNPDKVYRELIKHDYFNFETIIPSPQKQEDCPLDCINDGNDNIERLQDRPWFHWYNWQRKYWGTKWNSYCNIHEQRKRSVYIQFDTAWTPPLPIFKKLIEMYGSDNVSIHSYEEWGEKCFEHTKNNKFWVD